MTQLKLWHKLLIGLAVLILGAGIAYLVTSVVTDNQSSHRPASNQTTKPLVEDDDVSSLPIKEMISSNTQNTPAAPTTGSATTTTQSPPSAETISSSLPISTEFVKLPTTNGQLNNIDAGSSSSSNLQQQQPSQSTTTVQTDQPQTASSNQDSPSSSTPIPPSTEPTIPSPSSSPSTTEIPLMEVTSLPTTTSTPPPTVQVIITATDPSPTPQPEVSTTSSSGAPSDDMMMAASSSPISVIETTTPVPLSTTTSQDIITSTTTTTQKDFTTTSATSTTNGDQTTTSTQSVNAIVDQRQTQPSPDYTQGATLPDPIGILSNITGRAINLGSSNESAYSGYQQAQWNDFVRRFAKPYHDDATINARKQLFMQNLLFIDKFNEDPANNLYKLGINQFADMSTEEINNLYIGMAWSWNSFMAGLVSPPMSLRTTLTPNEAEFQNTLVDWRNLTWSVPVNQGNCRDGAAFALLANIEAMYNRQQQLRNSQDHPYQPLKLNEHQILNCMRATQKTGDLPVCSGQLSMINVIERLQAEPSHSLISDAEYARISPSAPLNCSINEEMELRSPRVRVTGFSQVHINNLVEALDTVGPLTIAIDATKPTFHFYKSGLYHDDLCSDDYYNHHLLLVGYLPGVGPLNTDKSAYLARNSFGAAWGEGGYMRILDRESNKCLPKNLAIYPNIDVSN